MLKEVTLDFGGGSMACECGEGEGDTLQELNTHTTSHLPQYHSLQATKGVSFTEPFQTRSESLKKLKGSASAAQNANATRRRTWSLAIRAAFYQSFATVDDRQADESQDLCSPQTRDHTTSGA